MNDKKMTERYNRMVQGKGKEREDVVGAGRYGVVTRKGNIAVKNFKRESDFIRELVVTRYMTESPYVINCVNYDMQEMTMSTVLYNASLLTIMTNFQLTHKHKMTIFVDILQGVHHLHCRQIIHADLKPSNILININPLEAWIGDLGLSSCSEYSLYYLTAKGYKLPDLDRLKDNMNNHDLYSIAVIGAELFGNGMLREIVTPEGLVNIIENNIGGKENRIIRDILISFASGRGKYIDASISLESLGYDVKPLEEPVINEYSNHLSDKDMEYLQNEIKSLTTSDWKIERGLRGFWVLVDRLNCENCPKVTRNEYRLYIVSICVILSATFGTRGFKIQDAMNAINATNEEWNSRDVQKAISSFIDCEHCLNFLMFKKPKKIGDSK